MENATCDQRPEGEVGAGLWLSGNRAFQAAGTASAKVLGQEGGWYVGEQTRPG